MGIDYESKRGYIRLDYYGKTVSIKILPVGIHVGQLESILSLSSTPDKVKELRERFREKIVMLGVDDMDLFKGISLNFLAMKQLLKQRADLKGKVVLIQITNSARSRGRDVRLIGGEFPFTKENFPRWIGKIADPSSFPLAMAESSSMNIELSLGHWTI